MVNDIYLISLIVICAIFNNIGNSIPFSYKYFFFIFSFLIKRKERVAHPNEATCGHTSGLYR